MSKQALGELQEDKYLVSGHVRVPLLNLLLVLGVRLGCISLGGRWLKIAAMLSHVCQQQEIDLLTVALRVVVGIVWWRLEKLG